VAKHFVDNEKLLQDFKDYRSRPDVQDFLARKATSASSKASGEKSPKFTELAPPIPDSIFVAIYLIANNYARKPNWRHLPYLDEMICDGIAFCSRYAYNFDPERTDKPFSYITMGVHRAFLQRIAKEKHQTRIKNDLIIRAATGQDISYHGTSAIGSTTHATLLAKHVDDVNSLARDMKTTSTVTAKRGRPKKGRAGSVADTLGV
jgi:hypothetical protein